MSEINKHFQLVSVILLAVIIFIGISICQSFAGANNKSNEEAILALKTDKSIIRFTILSHGKIKSNGFGMAILVSDKATKKEVLDLAKNIRNQFSSKDILTVSIFDKKEAWQNRSNDNYPESKYFKHYLVELTRNKNTGYDEIQWTAKKRKH